MEARFKIGQKFTPNRKHARECTVTDILKTYNSKGELVKIRYEATHEFMGQLVTDYDVTDTTIAMGIPNFGASPRQLTNAEAMGL